MLVELGVVEQRHRAVLEVIDGANVTDVALLCGVSRKTVHKWLRRYAAEGLKGLADKSSKPDTCPHQMAPAVEARIVEMRRAHPGWGPRTIRTRLAREGVTPVPGRSSVHRALIRHGLVDPTTRKRRRSDYKRWERSRAMELWQMDVVGRFHLADGTEVKVVTGVDDHSRFCVCARIVARATARPVVAALRHALGAFGVPAQIVTDNGKVFTARFGFGPGSVLSDQVCAADGIRHLLTAPYSPTTTGKVERFHRTLRKEFFGAMELGRRCIGFDTSHTYLATAQRRVKQLATRIRAEGATLVDAPIKRVNGTRANGLSRANGHTVDADALPITLAEVPAKKRRASKS